MSQQTPAKRDEFRARPMGYELRDDGGDLPTLVGTLAVFNEWAEINSASEGHFLERLDPGAFTKTIKEGRDSMRVLFQHGKDPQIGDKPLGPIQLLEARAGDVAYEVPLIDTSYNRDVAAMLEAGVLGSSFRFKVMRESVDRKPSRSAYNPKRLPERTVQEVRMQEFGPVTFPAYAGAKAGLRSLTDRMSSDRATSERMDLEDLSTIVQMVWLGRYYIEEQDEPDDAPNIPVMQDILKMLESLAAVEVVEQEPENEDEEASSDSRHAPPNDAALTITVNGLLGDDTDIAEKLREALIAAGRSTTGTSAGTPRTTSWPLVPSLNALHVSPRTEESLWNRTT